MYFFASELSAKSTGNGKSTAVKTMLWRQAGYYGQRRFIAISDPKGEYGPLSAATGDPDRQVAARRPRSGSTRSTRRRATARASVLARQTLLIGMIGIALGS